MHRKKPVELNAQKLVLGKCSKKTSDMNTQKHAEVNAQRKIAEVNAQNMSR
jgi:hypothetical protein